ncbi:mrna 3 -end-processing protein rna14 [Moniliophthora roreri MCA 2997]|uniref:mRNA 3'-end-processing protein RNA14 n=1 Tax=Moniliophthora roreri (strain MCA 2997) TaxID=1381753 RepID=V2WPP9_MONRO|nr:mrna 3 -end-processing protein rna14 [Moniliophthora roreri MCA 2997]
MAYKWLSSIGDRGEALSQLRDSIQANSSSFLLNFSFADALEAWKEYQLVHELYKDLLSVLRTATWLNDDDLRDEFGMAYIMYMRFVRHAEGIEGSQSVFSKARKDVSLTLWPVYEAAAMMEYHYGGRKDVSLKVFKARLKLFQKDHNYALHYLEWLISINDMNNAQSLFEATISGLLAEHARQLWDCWLCYSFHCSDWEAIQKLKQHMMQTYPMNPPMKHFAQCYLYAHTDPIATRDLGFAVVQDMLKVPATVSDSNVIDKQLPTSCTSSKHSLPKSSTEPEGLLPKRWQIKEKFPVPAPLCSFLGQLLHPLVFNGPVIDADELLSLLKNMTVPLTQ